jgi:hypothetical protein
VVFRQVARQAATSSLSGLMLPARIVASRRVSNRALVGGVGGMCHAWLLRSRHGPDGARAHTGYAYGHSARAELRPKPRCTHKLGLALGPPSRRSAARGQHRAAWSHNYTPSAEGACEVTRPHGSISHFGEEGRERPTVRTTEKCGARFGGVRGRRTSGPTHGTWAATHHEI